MMSYGDSGGRGEALSILIVDNAQLEVYMCTLSDHFNGDDKHFVVVFSGISGLPKSGPYHHHCVCVCMYVCADDLILLLRYLKPILTGEVP